MEWKRNKDYDKLTIAKFIQNTIEEEQAQSIRDVPISEIIDNTIDVQELKREGYYRAIAILDEIL